MLGAQAEAQIRVTVRHLLEAGATKQEIAEAIGLMGVFGGVPAMTKAMELAGEVMDAPTASEDDDMTAQVFAFYLFAIACIAGGLFTVISRNPVHSVLWLILSFLSAAGLVRAFGGRVRGDAVGDRLRGRGGGAVPLRRDDAGRGFRRVEGGDGALYAAGAC